MAPNLDDWSALNKNEFAALVSLEDASRLSFALDLFFGLTPTGVSLAVRSESCLVGRLQHVKFSKSRDSALPLVLGKFVQPSRADRGARELGLFLINWAFAWVAVKNLLR